MENQQQNAEPNYFDFDNLVVPFDLGVMEYTPPPELWKRYQKLMGTDSGVFITNAMRPRAMMTYRILPLRPNEQHINAGHEAQYFNPPIPGKRLKLHSVIIEKQIRRGKPYLITETEVTDEDGRLIERFKRTSMVKSPLLGQKWWAKPSRDTEIGAELEPLTKVFTMEMMAEFEALYSMSSNGYHAENFHNDEEAAKAAGLRVPIASAHCSITFMHQLLNNFFGPDWVKGGSLSLKLIRPILVDDKVTYKGRVKEKLEEKQGVRLVLDVWTENQRGQQTAVGSASGLVD